MTELEFTDGFITRMVAVVGSTFSDGRSVAEYAKSIAPTYWADEDLRADGPEECADNELYYGAQDNG